MPDSLVERLREQARRRANYGAGLKPQDFQEWEAADALERQSAELAALREQVARLEKDAGRLDWLEREANEPDGLLLHSEHRSTGRRGLGLGCIGRSLRQAIDQAAEGDAQGTPEG